MSSEENIATIRRFHSGMEAGDREALGHLLDELAHPECEWFPLVTQVEGGAYRGKQRTRAFFDDFLGAFTVSYEKFEIEALGDKGVLVLSHMKLRGRESGIEMEQEMGVVYELEGGLFRRGRAFATHGDARAAAEEVAV